MELYISTKTEFEGKFDSIINLLSTLINNTNYPPTANLTDTRNNMGTQFTTFPNSELETKGQIKMNMEAKVEDLSSMSNSAIPSPKVKNQVMETLGES